MLQGVVKHLNMTLFSGQEWVFQHETVPAQKAKMTKEWLQRNVPVFISAEDWPSGSPDLNPPDYKLWSVLEDMACRKGHNNLDCLTRSLMKAVAEIPLEKVRAAIAVWLERLKACVGAENVEWHYYK